MEKADSELPAYAAFDPWEVKIGRESKNSNLEWCGEIRDMAASGGFVRLHINGRSSFYADIPIETYEKEDYQIGETIYTSVSPNEVRTIKLSQEDGNHAEQKLKQRPEKKVKRRKWKRGYTLAAFLVLTFLMFTYGVSSQPANGNSKESQIEMFSLVAANATDPFSNKADKCDFCESRVEEGELPACTATCPTDDIIFGYEEEPVLLRDNLQDSNFINHWTNASLDEWRAHYLQYTPEWAEQECGVPSKVIEEIARVFAKAAPNATTITNRGVHAHENGFYNEWAVICLKCARREYRKARVAGAIYPGM